jgi:integrase
MSTRASDEAVTKTGFTGVWIHGKSIRVDFMYKGVRHRHTLGIEPTRANLEHAARLRGAALFALKNGKYDESEFFPHSRSDKADAATSKRLGDLCKLYVPLEAVDITPETESRYETALDECLETIGRDKQVDIPERTVVLLPPAREALRVLIEDASGTPRQPGSRNGLP